MQTGIDAWDFNLEGELFSEHFLKDRLPKCKEFLESKDRSKEVFDEIKTLYNNKKDILKTCEESNLEEFFIKPILEKMGHIWDVQPPVLSEKGIEYRPDYALFSDESVRDEAIKKREEDSDRYFELSAGLAEAKKWGEDLDKGKTRSPAVQIKKYLRITQINWGILTNGKKWRLYCKESGFSSNVYLEFDLEKILVNNNVRLFQYFYTILNQKSFLKKKEKSFLDRIYDENIRFARGVEDDLEKNVYEALKILSEGFLNFYKNDLDEEDIQTIHDNCLILLYRLLFLFYAESKKLIRFENGTKRYSLLNFTNDILEEKSVSPQDDYNWKRLKRSFDIVNKGSLKVLREKGIPPYNGGLFDPDKHGFLEEYSVGDSYLKEALNLLAKRKSGEWVDYETLQIRHLGSIYEKLLEYKLEIAKTDLSVDEDGEYGEAEEEDKVVVKKGEVYLVTDKGERKATGSYYTPDYVVQYIVENTVGKLIEERTEEARQAGESEAKAILQLKVLDPAMGSGHFLVAATDYMAEELLEAIHRDVENSLWDKNEKNQAWAKREIVSHCIYGVDLNPLAVELAKLSLWLTTFAEGHPLNFLDHRLKCGNSLVGTEIDKLPYFPGEEKKGNLYTPYIKKLTEQVAELLDIEEETVNDVKKKERLFKKIKQSKAYNRVKVLADARTSTFFDVSIGGEDPKKRYMDLVNEAYYGDESKWNRRSSQSWVKKARKIAREKNFFHWELEFPEVFFEKDDFKENPGFDAIIGNPPYIRIQNMTQDEYILSFFEKTMKTPHKNYDIYVLFNELGWNLLKDLGLLGFIQPNKFFKTDYGRKLRQFLRKRYAINQIVDFSENQIFPEVTTYTCITILDKNKKKELGYLQIKNEEEPKKIFSKESEIFSHGNLSTDQWDFDQIRQKDIFDKLNKNTKLEKYVDEIYTGTQTSDNDVFILKKIEEKKDEVLVSSKVSNRPFTVEKGILRNWLNGKQINPFHIEDNNLLVICPYKINHDSYSLMTEANIKSEFPKTYAYLERNKQRLLRRDGIRDENWYGFGYPKNMDKMIKEKIVSPSIAAQNSFTLDNKKFFFKGAYFFPVEECDIPKFYLLAVLNSKLLTNYVASITSKLRGGYFSYYSKYIRPLPINYKNDGNMNLAEKAKQIYENKKSIWKERNSFLKWISREWDVDIEDLSLKSHMKEYWKYEFNEILRITKKNKSKIDKNPSSRKFQEQLEKEWIKSVNKIRPLIKENMDLQSEIDALVFDLYNLKEKEVKTVLTSLRIPEKEKKDILKKFRIISDEEK